MSPVAVGIAVLTLVKVAIAVRTELGSNEAYHWLYAQHPALGYYNHPAMVAWMIGLSTALFGHGSLGVRVLPILAGSGSVWLTYLAAKRLYGERTGRWAALLVGVVPELFQWGSLAYPDSPLVLFWAATFWALAQVFAGGAPAWWYAAGAFLGLSMLSKYQAVFIGVGVLLFLAASPDQRAWLKRREPYLASALALLVFSPTIVWNAVHGWESFRCQTIDRFEGPATSSDRWTHIFPVTEFIHLTPVIAAWAMGRGLFVLARWRGACWQDRLAASLSMPLLLFFAAAVPFTRVRGHWTLPAYPSLLVLSAAFLVRGGPWGRRLHAASAGILAAAYLGLAIALVALPDAWLSGWSQLASKVRERPADFVISPNYHVSSQLAYHLRPVVATDSVALGLRSQSFSDWWRPDPFVGKSASIIFPERDFDRTIPLVRRCFDRVGEPERIDVTRFWGAKEKFVLVSAEGYQGEMPPREPWGSGPAPGER
jgi:hypothetical protein